MESPHARWGVGLYFGQIPGLLTKLIWLLASLSPPVLAVTGILIWWKTKPRKQRRATTRQGQAAEITSLS